MGVLLWGGRGVHSGSFGLPSRKEIRFKVLIFIYLLENEWRTKENHYNCLAEMFAGFLFPGAGK